MIEIGNHPSAVGDKNYFHFLFVKMKYRSVRFAIVLNSLLSKKNNYRCVCERDIKIVIERVQYTLAVVVLITKLPNKV